MHPIISSVENDNFSLFKKEIESNINCLKEKDSDGWNLLALCIQYEMPEFVEYLLERMSIEDINNQFPDHPVIIAMNNNSELLFDILLKSKKIDIEYKQKSENLLFNAFYNDNENYFNKLLAEGVNPYEKNRTDSSPFSLAIEANKNDIIKTLVEKHQLQENYDDSLITKAIKYNNNYALDNLLPYTTLEQDKLFSLASGFNNIYAMSQILDMGGFIPGHEQIQSMIELMCKKYTDEKDKEAAFNVVDYLFTIKVPFNQFVNKSNQSAWMLAIENDNIEVFGKLVKTTEGVNLSDNEMHTPLMYAIEHSKVDFVAALLKKKANPNQPDRNKNTPLIKSVMKGNKDIVKELLKYSAHINEINQSNETALSLAVKMRRMDIVSDLIWAGGELTTNPAKFVDEENVYHFNLSGQYEKLMTFHDEKNIDNFVSLSQLGFNINQVNDEGDTFLLHFIKNGFMANFKTLLRCAMNPNQKDAQDNSAAMCAMSKNSGSYLETLFARFNDIDLKVKNISNETIYDICIKQKRTERMESLINYDDHLSLENAKKATFFLAQHGKLENCWEKLSSVFAKHNLKELKDSFSNNILMLSLAGNNKKDYDFILKNNLISNMKEKNHNEQNIYQLIESLPDDKKEQYKQSIVFYCSDEKFLSFKS